MFRSLFLALGVYVCLLGVEALAVEKAVVKRPQKDNPQGFVQQEIVPPEWAPWSLMAAGSVVMLYSFTIPRRVSS